MTFSGLPGGQAASTVPLIASASEHQSCGSFRSFLRLGRSLAPRSDGLLVRGSECRPSRLRAAFSVQRLNPLSELNWLMASSSHIFSSWCSTSGPLLMRVARSRIDAIFQRESPAPRSCPSESVSRYPASCGSLP